MKLVRSLFIDRLISRRFVNIGKLLSFKRFDEVQMVRLICSDGRLMYRQDSAGRKEAE
jgi:hypothetical protein